MVDCKLRSHKKSEKARKTSIVLEVMILPDFACPELYFSTENFSIKKFCSFKTENFDQKKIWDEHFLIVNMETDQDISSTCFRWNDNFVNLLFHGICKVFRR